MPDHNYTVYIAIWLALSLATLWLFKTVSRKMKDTDDHQLKNSLFTFMIIPGIPMLLAVVLGPLVFLIGDKNMAHYHRIIWFALIFIFIVYFIVKNRSPKHSHN